jgi:hypothetical protein
MLLPIILTSGLLLMALAAIVVVLRKIQAGTSGPADVAHKCLVERYRPMLRLMDDSHYGCIAIRGNSRLLRRFRAERRSLFRMYLRDLAADHASIVGAIRQLLVDSALDSPDLAKALYRCQLTFALSMLSIEFNLLLHAMGIGTVDVRSLFTALDRLQLQFQDMVFVQTVGYGQ